MLTKTAKFIAAVTMLPSLLTADVSTGTSVVALDTLVASVCAQQLGNTRSAADQRRQAKDLLHTARQRLNEKKFDEVEFYLKQIDELDVRYEGLRNPFADSTIKVRRDLAKARQADTKAQLPSQQFASSLKNKISGIHKTPTTPKDPFKDQTNEKLLEQITNGRKAKATRYLENGRQAIRQKNLAGALGWYQKAASMDTTYAEGEYTPLMLAKELQQAGIRMDSLSTNITASGSKGVLPPAPSQSVADRLISKTPPVPTPRLPATINNPHQPTNANQPLLPETHQLTGNFVTRQTHLNDTPLLEARRALAADNVQQAVKVVDQVKAMGLVFPLNGDSPARISTLIQQHQQLKARLARENSADSRLAHARHLMKQAEALASYKDFANAQLLAEQAKSLNVQFGQFERRPEDLLEDLKAIARTEPKAAASAPPTPAIQPLVNESLPTFNDRVPPTPTLFPSLTSADSQENVIPTKSPSVINKLASVQADLSQARAALDRGDIPTAQRLVNQALSQNVPESSYGQDDTRPWEIKMAIDSALRRRDPSVIKAGGSPFGANLELATTPPEGSVALGLYVPEQDNTHVSPVSSELPNPVIPQSEQNLQLLNTPEPLINSAPPVSNKDTEIPAREPDNDPTLEARKLIEQGEAALHRRDISAAKMLFEQAWQFEQVLDPALRQRLQDHLQLLNVPRPSPGDESLEPAPLDEVNEQQMVLMRQLTGEVARSQREIEKISPQQPKQALEQLHDLRQRVAKSELQSNYRKQLLVRVDRSLSELERYIQDNRAEIELDEQNRAVLEDVDRRRRIKEEVQNRLAEFVEEFNELVDQERFAEASLKARQAREMAPDNEIAQMLIWKIKFIERTHRQWRLHEDREDGVDGALADVEGSATPFPDNDPLVMPNVKFWKDISSRRKSLFERQSHLSEVEQLIQRKLRSPVEVRFTEQPLSAVIDVLQKVTGVNMYLDPEAMAAEGITSDQPVTINLTQPVSLKSALILILQPLHLSHVIQNEVLKITSEQTRDSAVYSRVYYVADLVSPIPNFGPNYSIGMAAALQRAHQSLGVGQMGSFAQTMPAVMAAQPTGDGTTNPNVLRQFGGQRNQGMTRQSMGMGTGGLGEAVEPDFESLIELVTSTIAPTTWVEVGGTASIAPFDGNLSLVISQTQEVHEQIVDLLDQLRRLQDLQVTIEVRFITLSDNFFERIGVDFDFDIDDNLTADDQDRIEDATREDEGSSVTVGLDPAGMPTADLDLSFQQGSFDSTIPAFGGFDVGTAANFGFAILSDIEAFFVIQAAQGDTRTNILQAPKVTLFNGQNASVADTSQTPFVTSVIPVVGDFAAAQQPVIMVLSEGTSLNVQAVVSNDRRFVRLTLIPFFSKIGNVQEFTFTGRSSSSSTSVAVDPDHPEDEVLGRRNEIIEGTTIQLPTFSFTTVTTTVSVPDGGTVLLGGIKRLSEGRNERGVPMLSKIPYINRLFRNVGIGRESQSLMMMVTPRIIIQEEEEDRVLGQ